MANKISVSTEELENFAQNIVDIMQTLEKIEAEAQKIGQLTFYEQGQAKAAVSALQEIPGKYQAALQHYNRLLQLIMMTHQEMTTTDQAIAKAAK